MTAELRMLELIDDVSGIDTTAASKLLHWYKLLSSGNYTSLRMQKPTGGTYEVRLASNIDNLCAWASMPEGSTYWSGLHTESRRIRQ